MKKQPAIPAAKIDFAALRAGGVDTIAVAFPDHCGRLVGKRIPTEFFEKTLGGEGLFHTCNYLLTVAMELEPLPGFALAGWERGYGDFAIRPDPSSLKTTGWYPGGAVVVCNLLHQDGRPVEQSPRRVLERQVKACGERGLSLKVASELEFYLFRGSYDGIARSKFRDMEPTTPYLIDYSIHGTSADEAFLHDVRSSMN
ncbi:MAG: glutamine synthetase, partial [Myxococcota bacterium]